MGLIWSTAESFLKDIYLTLKSLQHRFQLPSISKVYEKDTIASYKDMPRTIREEIDSVNRSHSLNSSDEPREKNENEDFLPHCDLSVWLRDLKEEIIQPLDGLTTGSIPDWLNGVLIRNGPGGMTFGDYSFNHLFDASAVLHRFHIRNGKVTYQNRLLKSKTYEKNFAAQRIVVSEFGTRRVPDPCKTIFQRFASSFLPEEDSDNCLVSVYPFGDQVYTLTESATMYQIDPDTLQTLNSVKLSKYVNIVHHTSHPHVESDGQVSNLGLSVRASGPLYTIVEFPNTRNTGGTREKTGVDVFSEGRLGAAVSCRWPLYPGYQHTFGLTSQYYLIVEQPLSISLPARICYSVTGQPLYKILKWFDNYPTLIHVLSRRTGRSIATFRAEPFFYLHIINQYEEKGHIVIDICVYKDPAMIECMLFESLKTAKQNPDYAKMFRGRPVRFVLPLDPPRLEVGQNLVSLEQTKAEAYRCENGNIYVTAEVLCELGCEVPRINYSEKLGKKYRYFYAISSDVDLENPGTLMKVDVENKTKLTWSESGIFPSEPIFVPAPNPQDEDDGVVISSLLWSDDDKKVALLVLDGKTLRELGRTVFRTKSAIPKCLHGWYFPQSSS